MDFLFITLGVVVAVLIFAAISYFRIKKSVTTLTQEQFIEGYRKAQLIDVREAKDFANGHILGARNIPQTQLNQRYKEIRADKPVYIYDQNGVRSGRVALFLKKKGYDQLYQLQGGFKQWSGKVKIK
ncbi:rhodanese-like domain-containing protein [Planococcus sp. APC 3906]|uniref:rhodanese-like domain-containing protein n=1 Tax=Planococcus sp. APC 3906 TaxID=3035194 RepID=UPI0025B42E24|nr:rhodanese-like domain-containing protein [Planococcus sp. APC 3906]MDN3449898.1 rhodanese-like domain-containing protein [Planococcus sp. APC 3906]